MNCPHCSFASLEAFAFCPKCGTKLPGAGATVQPLLGRTLNSKYRVLREVGAGSMGTVYEGEHISLKKRVALKVLHASLQLGEESLQRFQREGIAAGQFTHPNAIQIFDFDRDEGPVFYLAMEYVEGLDLKRMIREDGALPVEVALHIARQILGALAEAHHHGIVHRDLKPENVMVIRGSGPPRIKVLDFGLSKLVDRPLDASLTEIGRVMGTPLYMSPEQVAGDVVDHRTDLYAVGLILYEMLAGLTPFSGSSLQVILAKHLKELPPPLLELAPDLKIPEELETVLKRALEKQREARFQSAEEMLSALNAVDLRGPLASAASSRVAGPSGRGPADSARGSARGLPRWALPAAAVLIVVLLAWAGTRFAGGGAPSARQRETPPEARTPAQREYLRLLDSARADLLVGQTGAALSKVVEALRAEVADAEAYLVRGLVFRAKKDDDMARADFEEALRLAPGYGDAAAQLGWIRLDQGDHEGALEHFLEAGRIDPGCAEALAGQGALRLEEGRHEDARRLIERALELDPDSARAHLLSGRARLAAGEPESAVESFVQAKRREPGSWPAYSGLGQAYLALSRWEDAEQQFREAIELAPQAFEPRATYGRALLERGELQGAVTQLTAAVERRPDDPELLRLLGLTLVEAGFADGAIAQLARAVALGPSDPRLRTLLGILEQDRGRSERALEHYDAALALDEGQALAQTNRGALLLALGRHVEAREALERAVALDPEAPFPHLCLGALYMEFLGEPRLATQHLRRYQELGGNDPRAAEWLRRRVR